MKLSAATLAILLVIPQDTQLFMDKSSGFKRFCFFLQLFLLVFVMQLFSEGCFFDVIPNLNLLSLR